MTTALSEVKWIPATIVAQLRRQWIETAEELIGLASIPECGLALARNLAVERKTLDEWTDRLRQENPSMASAASEANDLPPLLEINEAKVAGSSSYLGSIPGFESLSGQWVERAGSPPQQAGCLFHPGSIFRAGAETSEPSAGQMPSNVHLSPRLLPPRPANSPDQSIAWAILTAREGQMEPPTPLSTAHLELLSSALRNRRSDVTRLEATVEALVRIGVCTEEDWRNSESGMTSSNSNLPEQVELGAWRQLVAACEWIGQGQPSPLNRLIQWLAGFESRDGWSFRGRPIAVLLPVHASWRSFGTARSGKVFPRLAGEPALGCQAFCLVGFQRDEQAPGGGWFVARHPWGADWGAGGKAGAGHLAIPFAAAEEAISTGGGVAVALVLHNELTGLGGSDGGDPFLAKFMAKAQALAITRQAKQILLGERVSETIRERQFRPDQTLASERTVHRQVEKYHLTGETAWDSEPLLAHPQLSLAAAAGAVQRAWEGSLAQLLQSGGDWAAFWQQAEKTVPREDWVKVLVWDPQPEVTNRLCLTGRVERPFPALPVLQLAIPPFQDAASLLERSLGTSCAVPQARFQFRLPTPQGAGSQMVRAADFFGVNESGMALTGQGCRVGIVDTGLDLTHPDLRHIQARQTLDCSGDGDMTDLPGHGTHCVSVILGRAVDPRVGAYSMAPDAEARVAKVFDRWGNARLDALLAALDWMAREHVAVLSISLGTAESSNGLNILTSVCNHLAVQGPMIICASAGNDGPELETICAPAEGEAVIAVVAVDSARRVAEFSSRGSPDPQSPMFGKPDVAGPGVQVFGARSSGSSSTPPAGEGRYVAMSGTSMAAPAVAGFCALLWSACSESNETRCRDRVVRALFQSCEPALAGKGPGPSERHEGGRGVPDLKTALHLLRGLDSRDGGSEAVSKDEPGPAKRAGRAGEQDRNGGLADDKIVAESASPMVSLRELEEDIWGRWKTRLADHQLDVLPDLFGDLESILPWRQLSTTTHESSLEPVLKDLEARGKIMDSVRKMAPLARELRILVWSGQRLVGCIHAEFLFNLESLHAPKNQACRIVDVNTRRVRVEEETGVRCYHAFVGQFGDGKIEVGERTAVLNWRPETQAWEFKAGAGAESLWRLFYPLDDAECARRISDVMAMNGGDLISASRLCALTGMSESQVRHLCRLIPSARWITDRGERVLQVECLT